MPVRLSTQTAWNIPSAPAAKPDVCPGLNEKLLWLALIRRTFPPLAAVSPPTLAPPDRAHSSSPPNFVGASETRMLESQVSPPSSDERTRRFQPRLSLLSRRSYQVTATTPALFTSTTGLIASGPLLRSMFARSSLITTAGDQVFPLSLEYENMISSRLLRKSDQTT